MKKIILLFTLLLMSLSSISFASSTQFNQPVYIGWYANTRAGGPSPAIAEGYDSKTYDSFTFGRGTEALTFKFENRYYNGRAASSISKGVFIGKNFITKRIIACPEIYKITDNKGRVFYLAKGITSSPEQVFLLMGKCAGSYYNAIQISDLQKYCPDIEFMDHDGAPHLENPYIVGNEIRLPYKRSYWKSGNKTGEFIFKWNDEVQWFSIQHIVY